MIGSTDELEIVTPERPGAREFFLRALPSDLLSCLAIAVVLTLLLTPFLDHDSSIGWLSAWLSALLLNSLISCSIGLTIANYYRFVQEPVRRRFPGRAAYWLTHLAGIGIATTLGVEIALRLINALGGPPIGEFRPDVLRIGLVVATVAVAINVTYDRLRERARENEHHAEEAKKQALKAELRALQASTNPHFLFNSLNTVAGLIEEDPAAAEKMLESLSSLFRYALRGSRLSRVRLSEELAAVRAYLEVESVRLGDRLQVEVSVANDVGALLVPPLILQPLVENAVHHAVAPRKSGGHLRLEAIPANGSLVLTVTDNGPGAGRSAHRGTGASLSDLKKRLAMIYGDRAMLKASGREAGGFEASVTLPLEETGER